MNKYAIIPIELYNADALEAYYPVNIEYGKFQMLEYVEQPDPIGEGWVIFSGDNSNIDCAEFIEQTINEP